MLKEWTRDYATGAFIRYANRGCPSAEEYEQAVKEDVYRRLATLPPNVIVMKAEAALSARRPLIEDFLAVRRALEFFNTKDREWVPMAVSVIFKGLSEDRPTSKNEITQRVRAFSQDQYISEASVWRALKQARLLFSRYRGISIGVADDDFLF